MNRPNLEELSFRMVLAFPEKNNRNFIYVISTCIICLSVLYCNNFFSQEKNNPDSIEG